MQGEFNTVSLKLQTDTSHALEMNAKNLVFLLKIVSNLKEMFIKANVYSVQQESFSSMVFVQEDVALIKFIQTESVFVQKVLLEEEKIVYRMLKEMEMEINAQEIKFSEIIDVSVVQQAHIQILHKIIVYAHQVKVMELILTHVEMIANSLILGMEIDVDVHQIQLKLINNVSNAQSDQPQIQLRALVYVKMVIIMIALLINAPQLAPSDHHGTVKDAHVHQILSFEWTMYPMSIWIYP